MMYNALLIDDEVKALELLQTYIEQIPFLQLKGKLRDPQKALRILDHHSIDVLFLDINLPNLNGIEFYTQLQNPPKVIFTTAYAEYAVKGFDLEAVDYLLKPITFKRFSEACRRLIKKENGMLPAGVHQTNDLIYIKSGATIHKLFAKDVIYLQRDENYVVYHTHKKRILSRQTLSQLEGSLPDYFVRIHKSYIISLHHLESIKNDEVKIGGKILPIGKTFRQQLNQLLSMLPGL